MRYHLFQKFFVKMVKIKEMSFLPTRGMGLMFGNCMYYAMTLKACFLSSVTSPPQPVATWSAT